MLQFFSQIWILILLCITEISARGGINPVGKPSSQPTLTLAPSKVPTFRPTLPTNFPTKKASTIPSKSPSFRPNVPSNFPSKKPTQTPSKISSISPPIGASTWSQVNVPGDAVTNPILLTDGRVMLFGAGTRNVYLLTPDSFGKYKTGTVKQIASLPAGYCPLYFASATLPDGRVIIAGGEYNCGFAVWTNRSAIYDPLKNIWARVAPLSGSNNIGDAASVILPDGTFLLQDFFNWNAVAFNAATLTWTRKLFKNKKTW